MGRSIPFSEDELLKIEQLLKENTPVKKIAALLGRSENGVSSKISQFGGVLNFSAKKSIEYRKNVQKKMSQQSTKPFRISKYRGVIDRVEALEMQIQILTQVIKTHVKNTNDN